MTDSGLVGSTDFSFIREGFRESRRCSRDTCPESYITEYILVYEEKKVHRHPLENARTPIQKVGVKIAMFQNTIRTRIR